MGRSFQQYIITRFNVPIVTMLTKQLDAIDVTTDEKYLDKRFSLFEKYTVPSMLNQTNKDFMWIILFSDKTPAKYQSRMRKIADSFPIPANCRPVYVSGIGGGSTLMR